MSIPTICELSDYVAYYMKMYYYTYKPDLKKNDSLDLHNGLKNQFIMEYLNSNDINKKTDLISTLTCVGVNPVDFSKGQVFDQQFLYTGLGDIFRNKCDYIIEVGDHSYFYFKRYTHDWLFSIMNIYHY